jgi:ADP-heptose:LPS heptosyltransferase
MTRQPNESAAEHEPTSAKPDALLGIFDFSYQHYALGDLLTSQVNLAIMAIEQGLQQVDIIVAVNPSLPGARKQTFVTPANYIAHLDNILPVFACNPLLRSLQLMRDVQTVNFLLAQHHRDHKPMWPDLKTHLGMRQDFPVDHRSINAFHARNGSIPQLSAPRGHEDWARHFHASELKGRPLVVINPRQSSLTENPTATTRDAPLPVWHAFIDAVAEQRPEVLFVLVGGFQEWEHHLLRRRNVFVPRAWGLRLAHELALLKIADLFMGASSGFATFATFAGTAYAVVNVEHRFAPHAEVRPYDRHYPFAKTNQILTWQRETTDELLSLFRELYSVPRSDSATKSEAATQALPRASALRSTAADRT